MVAQWRLAEQRGGPIGHRRRVRRPRPAGALRRHRSGGAPGPPARRTAACPSDVDGLDELLMVVPQDTPLRVEATLGWHLYGTDLALQAQRAGAAGRRPRRAVPPQLPDRPGAVEVPGERARAGRRSGRTSSPSTPTCRRSAPWLIDADAPDGAPASPSDGRRRRRRGGAGGGRRARHPAAPGTGRAQLRARAGPPAGGVDAGTARSGGPARCMPRPGPTSAREAADVAAGRPRMRTG